MPMRNKIFILSFLFLILLTNCSLIKYEVNTYSRPGMSLKLYSNSSFKIFMISGLVGPNKLHGSEAFNGKYKKLNDTLILIYNKFVLTDTLYSVVWGENVFMMDKFDILSIANGFNNRRYTTSNSSESGWEDNTKKYFKTIGFPKFPAPYSQCILKDSIFANIIHINNDSLEITIDKGIKDGIFNGCELTNGSDYYSVNKVFADSSILLPANLSLLIEYNIKYGEEVVPKNEIEQLKISERKVLKPKYLYIRGSI